MAPRLFIFLNILLVSIATTTSLPTNNPKPNPKPRTIVIPVLKDTKTNLYITKILVGKPTLAVNLVVDVSASAIWFDCEEMGYNSITYTPVLCGSPECIINDPCTICYGPPGLTCSNTTCQAFLDSDLSSSVNFGHLYKDDVILSYMSPSACVTPKLAVRARLACITDFATVREHPTGSKGILGLRDDLVNALVSSYKIPSKVALCLPSSKPGNDSGKAYIGGGPYLLRPNRKDVTGLLVSTPLILDHEGFSGYYIDVKSIEVNRKSLSFKSKKGYWRPAKISNVIPYTRLETSIYKALVKAFTGKAEKRNAVAPFTDCFSYKSFEGKYLLGNEIPVISLVLGRGAKWDIYGPNSLVKVKKTVLCLAFENAGDNPINQIVIGGYQMEDNLVEFDLDASKFSFTSSLLRYNTSCSRQ